MDPQQELFTALLLGIQGLGYDVYDGALPPEDTPYPFVYLGDVQQVDSDTKNAVIGAVYPAIHIYHNNIRERGAVSSMCLNIKTLCRNIFRTDNFAWRVHIPSQRILPDNTTSVPLLHALLEPEFYFS